MIETARSLRGMVTSPHHLASEAGLAVLRDGGNAVEAVVAAAAAIAVVYPHMNSIGGDAFFLIAEPGKDPIAIDGSGPAAAAASIDMYRAAGHDRIPARGPLAANTVASAVSAWAVALEHAAPWGRPLPLARLLEEAVQHAAGGVPATASQARYTAEKQPELTTVAGFAETFLPDGAPPKPGQIVINAGLAASLEQLGRAGLDDFYRGDLARLLARGLAAAGSPVGLADLEAHRARIVRPLEVTIGPAKVWNLPPPTQGLASLMILGLFSRLEVDRADGFAYVHGLVEATKRAFQVRDAYVADPAAMTVDPQALLKGIELAELASDIDPRRAAPWPAPPAKGDTVWLGAVDGAGRSVSFIQSIYWEFGSGVVPAGSGIVWQNRGASFALQPGLPNSLAPGKRPFHTLNPAFARLKDGRSLVYGTMGGDGQPQTQAALFTRYAWFGQELQAAVSAPRWLLGRTWGAPSVTLKLEDRWPAGLIDALATAGHAVEVIAGFSDLVGHAGAIARRPDGVLEGASDPRSDGRVAAF